jgi:hypothetical protein
MTQYKLEKVLSRRSLFRDSCSIIFGGGVAIDALRGICKDPITSRNPYRMPIHPAR